MTDKTSTPSKDYEDLFLGLVGAVGTDLGHFSDVLSSQLSAYDYETEVISLTDIFKHIFSNYGGYGQAKYKRIMSYMDMGNKLREKSSNDFLAMHAIAKVLMARKKRSSTKRRAFIFKSLKHPDEIKFLRKVYGDSFYLLGLQNLMEKRISYLIEVKSLSKDEAKALVDRDQDEGLSYGQKLRDSYYLSDVFINGSNNESMYKESKRFIEILFGYPYHTPTFQENNMFQAYAASLKSSDLSRQVGAVIVNKYGDLVAQGFNDVPKAQGGLYSTNDESDARDFQRGYDSNRHRKNEIINEIIDSIKDDLTNEQAEKLKSCLNKGLENITEYGRAVHAEMEALVSAARVGVSIRGGALYTTTFPCHNCTKHIVASGIMTVIYIEPYPKSLAKDLHGDSVSIDKNDPELLSFVPFLGVGPRRYFDLFSTKLSSGREVKRKESDGQIINFDSEKKTIRLRLSEKSLTYVQEEKTTAKALDRIIKEKQLKTLEV